MVKKTYTVNGMDCTSCAMLIESDLADAGVKARCSYAKQSLAVEYDENQIQDTIISEVVRSAGYDVLENE